MRVLTPTGYRDIGELAVGDEVSAFDLVSGAPIVNTIEVIQPVDWMEWCRWHETLDTIPDFTFYLVNDSLTYFREQSVWYKAADGSWNVKHARDIAVGDTLCDDADNEFSVTSIAITAAPEDLIRIVNHDGSGFVFKPNELLGNKLVSEVEAGDNYFYEGNVYLAREVRAVKGWYRLEISNDHSFIQDGHTDHNASRFWVLGTASWTAINTTNWAASTGAAGGQTVPGSADTVTFDGSSGGGTVTVNFGGTITVQSITCGAFTGTLDFSANNNSVTLSAAGGFSGSGAGTRTINLGNGTWTLSATSASWIMTTTTGLTFNANSSTIAFSSVSTSLQRNFGGGGLTYNIVTFGNNGGSGGNINISLANTFATLNIIAPNYVTFPNGVTTTVTNAMSSAGSSGSEIGLACATAGGTATISSANNHALSWYGIRDMAFTGGGTPTATSSFDLGHNSGITITAPASSTGISRARAASGF